MKNMKNFNSFNSSNKTTQLLNIPTVVIDAKNQLDVLNIHTYKIREHNGDYFFLVNNFHGTKLLSIVVKYHGGIENSWSIDVNKDDSSSYVKTGNWDELSKIIISEWEHRND